MTPLINRRTLVAGLGVTLALPGRAQQGGSVVIYTSNNQQAFEAVVETAKKRMPGVKLSSITGGSGQLLRRLEAEAAKPQGDVFWSTSANTLGAFTQLLEPYRSPELAAFPKNLHNAQGLWSPANVTSRWRWSTATSSAACRCPRPGPTCSTRG